MSLSSRQLVTTARSASKRAPTLASIAQRAPATTLRTRSGLSRTVASRSRIPARSSSVLASRYYATVSSSSTASPTVEATTPVPPISPQNTYDIVIIGAGNAGLALAASLRESRSGIPPNICAYPLTTSHTPLYVVSKEHLLSNRRVLLVDGGKLDRVRNWKGTEHLENRVSSITAENVEFLKSKQTSRLLSC
jgi:ubiquinone biosynthesis monooxygenase Coq6